MNSNFPPNSEKSRQQAPPPSQQEKKLEPVAQGKRRKKPLGRQLKETFFSGDGKTAASYVLTSVLIPAAKDTLAEAGSQLIERIIFGDSRRRSPGGRHTGSSENLGHFAYNKVRSQTPSGMSARGRATHNFDEVILDNRAGAEEVLERLRDVVDQYEQVSVADLYSLVGERPEHTDHKWGWTDLRTSRVMPMRGGGYLLDLPRPEPLHS